VPSLVETWVPDRYVQTRPVATITFSCPATGSEGFRTNFPAGVRPPVNERQAP